MVNAEELLVAHRLLDNAADLLNDADSKDLARVAENVADERRKSYYPCKRLSFENGLYRVAEHEK